VAVPAPGVPGCQTYSSATTCLVCTPPNVLVDNQCNIKIIPHCAVFHADYTCRWCETGYYLDTTPSCVLVTTSNLVDHCLYYADNNKCDVCEFGYDLRNNGQACNPINTQFCFNLISDTQCNMCLTGYYPNNLNQCVPVPAANVIPNCQIQAADLSCLFCDPFFYYDAATVSCLEVPIDN